MNSHVSITSGRETDADRVRALEAYLRSAGSYTDTPREMDPALGESPVEGFLLGELSGHCEYFASGMVVLARSIDIPARLVNGFAGGPAQRGRRFHRAHPGRRTRLGRRSITRDTGWVRYDPTPPYLRTREDLPRSPKFAKQIGEFASMLELWWYQSARGRLRHLGSGPDGTLRVGLAWRSFRESTSTSSPRRECEHGQAVESLKLNVGFESMVLDRSARRPRLCAGFTFVVTSRQSFERTPPCVLARRSRFWATSRTAAGTLDDGTRVRERKFETPRSGRSRPQGPSARSPRIVSCGTLRSDPRRRIDAYPPRNATASS